MRGKQQGRKLSTTEQAEDAAVEDGMARRWLAGKLRMRAICCQEFTSNSPMRRRRRTEDEHQGDRERREMEAEKQCCKVMDDGGITLLYLTYICT